MKLTEIKGIYVGQVYEAHRNLFVVETAEKYINKEYQTGRVAMYERGKKVCFGIKLYPESFKDMKLIGKIGITHEIDDIGDIKEIKRSEGIQVNDVVKFNWSDPRLYVISREIDFGIKKVHPNNACFEGLHDLYGSRELVDFELKRVGILGVTHEFVNEKGEKYEV